MGNNESTFLKVLTVNMGPRHKHSHEPTKGWTEFRRTYLNKILEQENPDIVLVQESTTDLLAIDSDKKYELFPDSDEKDIPRIIFKKGIDLKKIEELDSIVPDNLRDRVTAGVITYKDFSIICASVHGKNAMREKKHDRKREEKQNKNDFLEFLSNLDRRRKEHKSSIVIGGDFNIDIELFQNVIEKLSDSSLCVVQGTASDQTDSIDYDFFVISKEVHSKYFKLRHTTFCPKGDKENDDIIDHDPTRILVSLKPLDGIRIKDFNSSTYERKNQELKKSTEELLEKLPELFEEREDHYNKLCEALKNSTDVKFDVVNPNFEKIRKRHKAIIEKAKSNLNGFESILLNWDNKNALDQSIEDLKQMDFVVKAHTTTHQKHVRGEPGKTEQREAPSESSNEPIVQSRGSLKKSKHSKASAELSHPRATPSTSGRETVAQETGEEEIERRVRDVELE